MPGERAKAELTRDELCAAARYSLHLAGQRAIALGDQIVICRSAQELVTELDEIRELLSRACWVFAHTEGLGNV